jgi:hypothetical protein
MQRGLPHRSLRFGFSRCEEATNLDLVDRTDVGFGGLGKDSGADVFPPTLTAG